MKKLPAILIASVAFIGTPAIAADMAAKAPAPTPAPPAYTWTGWYIGGNVGASMGRAATDINAAPGTLVSGATTAHFAGFSDADAQSPAGFIGGGQIGYNWQLSPLWVVGLEADIQGSTERDSINLSNTFTPATEAAVTNYGAKIEWFGTARVRAGYLWGNGVLSYVTGGLAYGKVELGGSTTISGAVSATDTFGRSHVNTGWTVGYGTEGPIDFWGAHNWTWKVESLYMSLGSLDTIGAAGVVATHTHFSDWLLRGGLNYQFH